MNVFRHSFLLHPPGPDGTQESRDENSPSSGAYFYSDAPILAEDLKQFDAICRSYQHSFEYTRELCEVLQHRRDEPGQPSWHSPIFASLIATMKEALGVDVEGAVVDYDDARMNELERSVRNQARSLSSITDTLARLVTLVERQPQQQSSYGLASDQALDPTLRATPQQLVPEEPIALTPQQQMSAAKGFPLVGTPVQMGGKDPTLPTNPNARGQGRTPEMASGVMGTMGPSATSRVLSYSGRVDDKGEPVFDNHELPRVGTTLRAGTNMSDIEVPK